ncbi:MAG: class I SAM-dependent methyltransferase [Candidatus Pacearchaeota archaeon]
MKSQEKIWDDEYQTHKNKWHKETTTVISFPKNSKVLEIGVGNGKTLKAILRIKPKELIAIDISREAIGITKNQFRNEKIIFLKSDVRELNFKENYFDVIVVYYTLNNLIEKDRKKAVREIYRVLKPKGVVLFQDFEVGDFRQKDESNKTNEKNTIQNRLGLICHFFTELELNGLFKKFSSIKLSTSHTKPITHRPELKRKLISGIITK